MTCIKTLLFIAAVIFTTIQAYGIDAQLKDSKTLNLKVYYASDSVWTPDLIEKKMGEAFEVFKQCGLNILWELSSSYDLNGTIDKSLESDIPRGIIKISKLVGNSNDVRVFFIGKVIEEGKQTKRQSGFARGLADDFPETYSYPKEVLNTVWMPSEALMLTGDHCHGAEYSVLAHELSHILTGLSSHTPEPGHILSLCMGGTRRNILTTNQCQRVLNHPFVQ